MRSENPFGLVAVIVALHVVLLSMLFGPRHTGYIVTATLSATLIWGGVYVLNKQKRQAGAAASIIAGLAVQQVAYQVWKGQLGGFWWPLAQFGALQSMVAWGIWRLAP